MHCSNGFTHFRVLIHKLFNNDPNIVPDEYPLIILDIKSDICMSKNVKDAKRTRYISRRVKNAQY